MQIPASQIGNITDPALARVYHRAFAVKSAVEEGMSDFRSVAHDDKVNLDSQTPGKVLVVDGAFTGADRTSGVLQFDAKTGQNQHFDDKYHNHTELTTSLKFDRQPDGSTQYQRSYGPSSESLLIDPQGNWNISRSLFGLSTGA